MRGTIREMDEWMDGLIEERMKGKFGKGFVMEQMDVWMGEGLETCRDDMLI